MSLVCAFPFDQRRVGGRAIDRANSTSGYQPNVNRSASMVPVPQTIVPNRLRCHA